MESLKFFIVAFTTLLATSKITIKSTSMDSPRQYLSCALSSTRSLSVMKVGRILSARLTDTEGGKCLSISFEALSMLVAEASLLMQEAKRMLLIEEERAVFDEDESSPYLQVRKRLELESGGATGYTHQLGMCLPVTSPLEADEYQPSISLEELETNMPLRPRLRALSRRGSDGPTCPRKRLCFGVEDVEVIDLTKDDNESMDY